MSSLPTLALSILAALPSTPAKVPLKPGLSIVTAISDQYGDYESIKTVESVSSEGIVIAYSGQVPNGQQNGHPLVIKVTKRRMVRTEDLRSAHEYAQTFGPKMPEVIPGTTAIGASREVLEQLKTQGKTPFTFQTPNRQASNQAVLDSLLGKGQSGKSLDELAHELDATKAKLLLERVEPKAVLLPVLLNGQRRQMPAVHARGKLDDKWAEFWFLDDSDNPLALKWTSGDATGQLQVVQITVPEEATASIEQKLKKEGRVEIHGIYFDVGSATLRPESEPVLSDISKVLAQNSAWKLSLEGHTDNLGNEEFNLDLSARRALAVKQALVQRYQVSPARLMAEGFGATRPKEPNTTLEGRARNRRVELVRQ